MSQRSSLQVSLLEEQDPANELESSRPAVVSPKARPGQGNVVTRWLHSNFPDSTSRWAAILAFLLALGVSIYWLHWTITSRWQYSHDHPVQSISFETVPQLPQLLGQQIFFVERFIPRNHTYARMVTAYLDDGDLGQLPVPAINCSFTQNNCLCQQWNQRTGSPMLNPAEAPPGELNGASAAQFDLGRLPLQFTSPAENPALCFTAHVLLNQTAVLKAGLLSPPAFAVVSLSARSTLSLNELHAAGHFDDALTQSWVTDSSVKLVGYFPFGRTILLSFSVLRTIAVDGSEALDYEYATIGDMARSDAQIDADFETFLAATPNPDDRARYTALRADPSTLYATTALCSLPQSMRVQNVREQTLYGISQFFSDLGGALNILTITMLLLFPLTYRAIRPRSFLPLWVVAKWRKRKQAHKETESSDGVELRDQPPAM